MPWNASTDDPSEVAGTYQIQRFQFAPDASVLKPINVLEYMEGSASTLELTNSRDFVLNYRKQNGKRITLTGTYTLTPKKVELKGQREDAELYQNILLDRKFYLLRKGPNVLWVDTQKNVAANKLSASYEGLTGVGGILRLELAREKSAAVTNR